MDEPSDLEKAVGEPMEAWVNRCHEVSLAIIRSGILAYPARVARGWAEHVPSQHSWIVLDTRPDDLNPVCYDDRATIMDPTLWAHHPEVEGVWQGTLRDGIHHPHQEGIIWVHGGRPVHNGGETITLDRTGLSRDVKRFLDLIEPLDRSGWRALAHQPVQGWPAREILEAMCDQGLGGWIPIDVLGMVTDRNPNSLYW